MEITHELSTRSDAELLRLAAAGKEQAFLLLYGRLKAGIFRYAFYMTSSKVNAEEVTQEVFITLLKAKVPVSFRSPNLTPPHTSAQISSDTSWAKMCERAEPRDKSTGEGHGFSNTLTPHSFARPGAERDRAQAIRWLPHCRTPGVETLLVNARYVLRYRRRRLPAGRIRSASGNHWYHALHIPAL